MKGRRERGSLFHPAFALNSFRCRNCENFVPSSRYKTRILHNALRTPENIIDISLAHGISNYARVNEEPEVGPRESHLPINLPKRSGYSLKYSRHTVALWLWQELKLKMPRCRSVEWVLSHVLIDFYFNNTIFKILYINIILIILLILRDLWYQY